MPDGVRSAILEACGRGAPPEAHAVDLDLGEDLISIAFATDRSGVRSFALRLIRSDPETASSWPYRLVALAIITIALVAVALDALLTVRRGALGLSRALTTIESDLRADIPPVSGKEFADVAGRIRRVANHLADARERERALERRIAHEHRLAALGRVVAGVAHEVRNPLTGMKLLLDGMARRSLDARSEEDVEVCLAELARLEHLVSSLLGVARSGETGRFVQDIGALVDERIQSAGDLARDRGVELIREGDARVLAVRDVLVRVIDNLLRNAIQASPRGAAVRVVVETTPERLVIDVRDEGPGVPEASRDELFEPFRTTKPDGTGLGLWLSHTALTAQGGDLAYRREDGTTHFIVTLPKEVA
jgi:signal transduction histidine kinase